MFESEERTHVIGGADNHIQPFIVVLEDLCQPKVTHFEPLATGILEQQVFFKEREK